MGTLAGFACYSACRAIIEAVSNKQQANWRTFRPRLKNGLRAATVDIAGVNLL